MSIGEIQDVSHDHPIVRVLFPSSSSSLSYVAGGESGVDCDRGGITTMKGGGCKRKSSDKNVAITHGRIERQSYRGEQPLEECPARCRCRHGVTSAISALDREEEFDDDGSRRRRGYDDRSSSGVDNFKSAINSWTSTIYGFNLMCHRDTARRDATSIFHTRGEQKIGIVRQLSTGGVCGPTGSCGCCP